MKSLMSVFWLSLICILIFSCQKKVKTDEELYSRTIFTDDAHKTKIQSGDTVTIRYWLKNGDKVIMSSDMSTQPTILHIPEKEQLSKFERPLMWLGLGDSCIAQINADEAVAELLSYRENFKTGDKATFVYKVLKIQ
ncbi:MAG: hypothetical protein MK207_04550 [Saprospiraceae bacterium]|nr:hypothetical protein [Saprospiraceae bacterium]